MKNKLKLLLTLLCLLLLNKGNSQGKLVPIQPQSPNSAALSNSLSFIFYGDKINLLVSENFDTFGGPNFSEWYLQQYDYSLNLEKEESIKDFNYPDTILSQKSVIGGWLANNSGYYIYITGINNSPDKSLFEVRDSSGSIVFSKLDFVLLDATILSGSVNYLHDFALSKNNRLYLISRAGIETASFNIDSLELEILNNYFHQADSLTILSRLASKPSTNLESYSLKLYKNGFESFYYCVFNDLFQLQDSIQSTPFDDYRAVNYKDDLFLRYDSTTINSNTYRSFYKYRDFNNNLRFSFQTTGHVIYTHSGPKNGDQPIFTFDGSLNLASTESYFRASQLGETDTVTGYRIRHYDSTSNLRLDHLFFKDGLSANTTSLSIFNFIGQTSNNEYIVPFRAYRGSGWKTYRSYLLKIDYHGNSPLKANNISTDKTICIYPNPSTQYLTIHSEESDEELMITVLDMKGKSLLNFNTKSNQQIDISILPRGTFYIQIKRKEKNNQEFFKFIKN